MIYEERATAKLARVLKIQERRNKSVGIDKSKKGEDDLLDKNEDSEAEDTEVDVNANIEINMRFKGSARSHAMIVPNTVSACG